MNHQHIKKHQVIKKHIKKHLMKKYNIIVQFTEIKLQLHQNFQYCDLSLSYQYLQNQQSES